MRRRLERHRARLRLALLGATLAAMVPAAAFAQAREFDHAQAPAPGWTLLPSLTTGALWDDNVLLQGATDSPASDQALTLSPSAALSYVGRHSTFTGGYVGGLTMYRDFTTLNTLEHTGQMLATRRLSKRTTLSLHQSVSVSPTTQVQGIVGVPFIRLGSRLANVGTQVDTVLTRRTSISASYNFEWVRFANDPVVGRPLVGGQSNSGRLGLRRQFGRRATATVDYDLQRAVVSAGSAFSVQNVYVGGDFRLSPLVHAFAMFGAARIQAPDLTGGRTLPSWRAGVARQFATAGLDVSYGRSFVPSYAGGGTQANEELTTRVLLPFGRRLYTEVSTTWRRDHDVAVTGLPLTSVWLSGALGYSVQRWARVELFYGGLRQRIARAGGDVNRNRVGLQISTNARIRRR